MGKMTTIPEPQYYYLLPRRYFSTGSWQWSLIHRLERLLAGAGWGACDVRYAAFGTVQEYRVRVGLVLPLTDWLQGHLGIFMGAASGVDLELRERELGVRVR